MRIDVTPEQFFTFVMMYLLDKINNNEYIRPLENEDVDELVDKLNIVRSHLTRYYLQTNTNERTNYRRMRRAFETFGYTRNYNIYIHDTLGENEKNNKEILNENKEKDIDISKDFYKLKDIVKDVVMELRNTKIRKSGYISQKEIDNLIEKTIKEKGE